MRQQRERLHEKKMSDFWQDTTKHQVSPELLGEYRKKLPTITFDRKNYALYVGRKSLDDPAMVPTAGSSFTLCPRVNSSEYTTEDIQWSITAKEVVSLKIVEDQAIIQASRPGVVIVIATLPNGEKAECVVTVIDNITRLTLQRLLLNAEKVTLAIGEKCNLNPIFYPKDYFQQGYLDTQLVWQSSDEKIVEVTAGQVVGRAIGQAQVRVSHPTFGQEAICTVTVTQESVQPVLNTTVSERIKLKVGTEFQLVNPFSQGNVYWRSTNDSLVKVNAKGHITALGPTLKQVVSDDGMSVTYEESSVVVLATAECTGKVFSYTIQVADCLPQVEKVILNKEKINLTLGNTEELVALITPSLYRNEGLTWMTGNQSIVTVKEITDTVFGAKRVAITALQEGETIITATFKNQKAQCHVHVSSNFVADRPLNVPTSLTLEVDQEIALLDEAQQTTGENKWEFRSSDDQLVTVDSHGMLKAYQAGSATIFIYPQVDSTKRNIQSVPVKQVAVTVVKSSPYLRNVHVVKESILANSCLLLWNRASFVEAVDFHHYTVALNGENAIKTTNLGCTLDELAADTRYHVTVAACNQAGVSLAEASLAFKTAAAQQLINVLDYGAIGDGVALDTYAIQKAIDACPQQGVVLLPKGYKFLSGALFLKSDLVFQIDGCLLGSDNPTLYPRIISKWEGWRGLPQKGRWANAMPSMQENCYLRASLLNIGVYDEGVQGSVGPFHTKNVTLCGQGQINANGFTLSYNEGPNKFLQLPQSKYYQIKIPAPIKNEFLRGCAISAHNVDGLYLKDLLVAYSPSWSIHLMHCQNVTVNNVEVVTQGNGEIGLGAEDHELLGHILNGDGLDPESCERVNVFACYFSTGDDAVTLKSGRNKEGNELRKPCAYVRITDSVSHNSLGGFGVGSDSAGGAHDILYQNLFVQNLSINALWFKTLRWRGGTTQYVQIKDIQVQKANAAIGMTFDHSKGGETNVVNPAEELPTLKNVVIENIVSQETKKGIYLSGLPEQKIEKMTIKKLMMADTTPNYFNCVEAIKLLNCQGGSWHFTDSSEIYFTQHFSGQE